MILFNEEQTKALLASELRYRRLFETAQDGILILSFESGQITDANPFVLGLLGYSHAEVLGKTVGELSPFKDIAANENMLEQLQAHGFVRYEDLPLQSRDGARHSVEFVSNVYEMGREKVIQCNIRNITARKQTEERLQLLSTCIAHLNDIVLVTEAAPLDEPGPKIVFVNPALERVCGYTAEETLGRSPRFLQGEKTDRKVLKEIRDAMIRQVPIRREIVNYRKDGSSYWLEIDLVPIFASDGRCTHFTAIERDITEAKKAEARFRRLVDSNAQGVMFWDSAGAITDANAAFLRLLEYSREDLEAGRIDLRGLTPPEFSQRDQRAKAELEAQGYSAPYEKELIRKGGGRVPVLVGAAAFEDNRREGVSFVVDLTDRKSLEHQFLRAQRMESIGTLAGGIAHDLNNILAPIMMSIEVLQTTATHPEAKKILDLILMSSRRGADIVRQVLTFARGVEGERIEIQPRHILDEIRTIIQDTFPKTIRLEIVSPAEPWLILGDPTQLHQILLNLCVNARDAMPHGGHLTITVENKVLDEHYAAMHLDARVGPHVMISVTDTGTGIAPAIIDKIFEPFFTTKGLGDGTGLGLSTVIAIAKSHGGFVNVYSEPGKGATFRVGLPARELSAGGAEAAPAKARLPRGKGELILLVDDEPAILEVTRSTLEAVGYRTLLARDGAEAVATYAVHRGEIAAVLTDVAMPIMDGYATIRALLKIEPTVKIVAASGFHAGAEAAKMPPGAVRHFLSKPYTAATLLETLHSILAEPGAGSVV